jgi:transposase
MRTLQEKIALVLEALEPGSSVAAVARKHGVNSNLLFGWLRLHQRGMLAKQRQPRSVPLLPVKVTTPTLTPTDPTAARATEQRRRAKRASASNEVMLELILPDGTCVRLFGEAQRVALERILAQLPSR